MTPASRAVGASLERLDGPAKVTGTAPYAFEHEYRDPAYLFPVSATIARGRVRSIDASAAEAVPGVLAVLTHENAPRLASDEDREYWVLQDAEVGFRGQYVAAVVAETSEDAREAAGLVRVEYDEQPHDAALDPGSDDLYKPDKVNAGYPTDSSDGDVEAALASAAVVVDATYTTPMEHNNPMEPHTTVALWDGGDLTLHDSTQGVHGVRRTIAPLFGLAPERVSVIAPHVGGGFGSKGLPHAHVVLAALAAKQVEGRPVKYAVSRQQMFSIGGYRTETIQHVRLGADEQGRLAAIGFDVVEPTSRIKEFAEQTALPARSMYAAPNRETSHRLAALDVPVPSWMRAPGECPGMFGLEVAMDELAEACGIDPIDLRERNDTETDPDSGLPWSSRNLVACLREGAARFGWESRDPTPGARRDGNLLVGTGVASSVYPVHRLPGSAATIRLAGDRYSVLIGAADLGTGTWTALTQIAADALDVPVDLVALEIGSTDLPSASVAGGSSGIVSWGSTIVAAARAFREEHGTSPDEGAETTTEMPANEDAERFSMSAFGAQFAEVAVDVDTGSIAVTRMLAVFAAGRIINPRTARSQFIGGMTMGLSMALHEQSVLDPRFGHVVNHDLAEYHVPVNADCRSIEAHWLEEDDPYVNPLGAKGIGEIGIVGAAAAVANAAYHATGVRVRELPVTADKLLG